MQRDMELVRKILLRLTDYKHGFAPDNFEVPGYTEELVGYHCFILGQANLLTVTPVIDTSFPSPYAVPISLTWQGHEFIENARNEKIWSQTKDVVSKLGNVSFSVWASVLSKIVMQNLGIDG